MDNEDRFLYVSGIISDASKNSQIKKQIPQTSFVKVRRVIITAPLDSLENTIKRKTSHLCEECQVEGAKRQKRLNMYLCEQCKMLEQYTLITKTHAKTAYFLKDDDLSSLESWKTTNSYKNQQFKTLYRLKDVTDSFALAHGVDPNSTIALQNKINELTDIKTNRAIERRNKIQQKKVILENKRKLELITKLNEHGLELRGDSNLCRGYISGTITNWKVDDIVERMCQVKYLFDYCHMKECLEEARQAQEELEAGYFPDIPIFDHASLIALEKYGVSGQYPDSWPWLD